MTTELNAIALKAQTQAGYRFQNLYGELKVDRLYQAWAALNKQSAAGVDGVKPEAFESRFFI